MALFPRSALPVLGGLVGWLAGTLLRIRRRHVERSMKLAGVVRSQAPRLATAMYASLGRSLVEMLWLAARTRTPARPMAVLEEDTRAVLCAARESGRGAVLATAHAGNWELAAAAVAEAYPLTVVAKPMSVGWVDRFCREARLARGIAVASPDGALGAARAALAQGRLVAMLIDQVPDHARHAVTVDFLCGSADADRSPATLAASANVPLVVAVSRRVGCVQRLAVLGVFEPPANGRLAWAAETTRTATRLLDRWIHAHPSEWLWMHRRWRRAPDAAPKRPGSPLHQARP